MRDRRCGWLLSWLTSLACLRWLVAAPIALLRAGTRAASMKPAARLRRGAGLAVLALLSLGLTDAAPTGAQAGGGSPNALDASLTDPQVEAVRDRWYADRIKADHSHPPFPEIPGWRRMAERQSEDRKAEEARRDGAAAKAEREASRDRYRDLGRRDAMELAQAKFKGLFSRADRRALPLKGSQEIKRYPSNTTAVVDDPESGRSLVHSTTPLRARDEGGELRPVDLDLVADGFNWTPRNSAAPVQLGSRPGRAMTLPGGLSLGFASEAGDGERVSNEIFFADVARDTDAWFSPTESGGRFALQLRSADSPEEIRLQVGLPDGVTLQTMPDQKAVQAVKDGKRVALITAPFAMDAEEETVAVTMRADGRELVIAVAHRQLDVLYPIAVDPSVYENEENFGWGNFKGCPVNKFPEQGDDDWCYYETVQKFPHELGDIGWGWGFGFYLHMRDDWFANGDFAEWQYWAPTDWSYIHRIDYMGARHSAWNSATTTGIWSRTQGYFLDFDRLDWSFNNAGNYWTECVDARWDGKNTYGACNDHTSHTEEARGNYAQISISPTRDGQIYYYPTVFLAGARVWLSDFEAPFLTYWYHAANQDQWVRDTPAGPYNGPNETHVRIDDRGLGMWGLWADVPGKSRQYSTDWGNCSGTYSSPCRASRAHNFSLVGMNEGTQTVTVGGQDILGQTQTWTKRYKVDRTNPTVAFSGDLAGRDGQALTGSSYPLTIDAGDPVPSGANGSSGVQRIELRVDGGKRATWTNPDGADGASQSQSWTLDLNDRYYREGAHTINVTAYDRAGNRSSRTLRFIREREAPVLSSVAHDPVLPTDWVDDELLSVTAKGHDWGSGVKHGRLVAPKLGGGDLVVSDSLTCAGTYWQRCPHRRNLLEDANWSWEWETANPWRSGYGQMGYWYVGPLVHGGVHFSGRRWPGSGDGYIWYDSARQPVVVGRTYSGHHYARPERSDVARGDFRSEIVFWDTNGNPVGQENGPLAYEEAGPAWKRSAGVRAVAPPSAASASLRMAWKVRDGTDQWHNADAAHLEEEVDVSRRMTYDTSDIAEGAGRVVRAYVEDAVGKASRDERWALKVDHTPPELTISGSLYDARDKEINNGQYTLDLRAKDGDSASPATERSGVEALEVWVDGVEQDAVEQECASSCAMSDSYVFDTSQHRGGEHVVEAVAIDQLGHESRQTFKVRTPCCAQGSSRWTEGELPIYQVTLGDVSGDGAADIVRHNLVDDSIDVRLSNRTSGFGEPRRWGTWKKTVDLRVADIDGDGLGDLAGREELTGAIHLARSTGAAFGAPFATSTTIGLTDEYHLPDIDGDESADLLARAALDGKVSVAYGGHFGFGPLQPWTTVDPLLTMHFGNVDADFGDDLITQDRDSNQVRVRAARADSFAEPVDWGTAAIAGVADMNGDLIADLVEFDALSGKVTVRPSDSERFGAQVAWGSVPSASSLVVHDVSGDLEGDLVGRSATGALDIALSNVVTPVYTSDPWVPDPEIEYDDTDLDALDDSTTRSASSTSTSTAAQSTKKKRSPLKIGFSDPAALEGAQMGDEPDDAAFDRFASRAEQTGATWVRIFVLWGRWEDAEQNPNGEFRNYRRGIERSVARLREYKLPNGKPRFRIYMTLTGAKYDKPLPNTNNRPTSDDPNPDEFGTWVGEIVGHFAPMGVKDFALWNEPNLPTKQGNRAAYFLRRSCPNNDASVKIDAQTAPLYRQLYDKGYTEGSKVAGTRFYVGELSESALGARSDCNATEKDSYADTAGYLKKVVEASSADLVTSGVAWHPYQHKTRPTNEKDKSGFGIGRIKEFQKAVDSLHKRTGKPLRTSGGKRPPTLLTEFGYFNKPLPGGSPRSAHSEAERKSLYRLAFNRARMGADKSPRVLIQYLLREAPEKKFDTGILDPNGSPLGDRMYGDGWTGQAGSNKRQAYCGGIYRWARRNRYKQKLTVRENECIGKTPPPPQE